jgi:hypothetical protein
MRRSTITLVAALALGLGLAGCSSSDDAGTVTGDTIPGVEVPTQDTGGLTDTGDDNGGGNSGTGG